MTGKYLVGITGASGSRYGVALCKRFKEHNIVFDLILSQEAKEILDYETDTKATDLADLAQRVYENDDMFTPPASGSRPVRPLISHARALTRASTAARVPSSGVSPEPP